MKTKPTTLLRRIALGAGLLLFATHLKADTIAAGRDFAGAIDATGVLRTWGNNASGQLGLGNTATPHAQPSPVTGLWKSVAMGQDFTLAIDTADALWAWGANASGQLGTGGTTASSTPVRVVLPTGAVVRAVAAGQNFALALVDVGADLGRVYAWGSGTIGQLGQGNSNSSNTPLLIKDTASTSARRYTAITATDLAVVAIATDGSLWAWGLNSSGEVGQGSTTTLFYTFPTRIGTLTGWTQLAAGVQHVLALRGTELYAWGNNGNGQVGNGVTGTIEPSPVRIAATQTWTAIGAGDIHSLGITSAGALYGWGNNQVGQLGLPVLLTGADIYNTPQLINTVLGPWAAAAGGFEFTVARTAGGAIYTTGGNTFGQLGNGQVSSNLNTTPSFNVAQVSGVNLVANAPAVPATTLGVNTIAQPVTVNVQNTGSATLTGSFVVSVYLSDDAVLDGTSDRLLATTTQSGPLAGLGSSTVTFSAPDLAIPEVPPGARFLISQVAQVGAADPLNPATGAATAVTISGPDLTLENPAITGSHTVLAGGTFTGVSATLRNGGVGAIPAGRAVLIKAYLGTTTTVNLASDVLVAQFTYSGGLAAGASVTVAPSGGTITVPASLLGGSYQLVLTVNDDSAVTESGSLPDSAALAVALQSHDLAVVAPSLPNVGAAADGGAKIIGTGTVLDVVNISAQNVGSQAYSGGFTVSLYLSTDGTLSADDILLKSATDNASLAAVTSRLEQFTNVAIPVVAPGNYQLLARIDPVPGNSDPGASNNTAALPVRLRGPDFTLTDAVLPGGSTVSAGGSFTGVTYTLRNLRNGALPASSPLLVQVYLSTDATFSSSADTLLDSYTYTAGLAAGPSSVALPSPARTISVPALTPGGAYQLLFVVNADSALAESGATAADTGTDNNVLAVPVTVSAADLAVTAPTPSATSIGVNTTLASVSTFVQNQDSLQAFTAGYTVELYLSADASFDAGDRLLASLPQAGTLNPVTSILLSWTGVAIPDVTPGSYFLLSRVVLPAGQTDRNAANNVAATAVTLVGPTLALNNFVFPNTTSVGAGGTFGNVSYKLANTGAGAVPVARDVSIEVFLSTDATLDRNADVLLDQYTYTGGLAAGGNITLPSPAHPINLPANVLNGVYNLLFVVNGNSSVAGTPVSVTAQQVAVGALDAQVTAPVVAGTSLGVNTTLPNTSVSVNNLGGFAIPTGTIVNLYLSADSLVDLGDTLLGTQTIATSIPGGATRSVTFAGLAIPDLAQGSYHLLAEIVLPTGLIDLNLVNNVADTPVTLLRPKLAISAVTAANSINLDLPSPAFAGVTFSLDNSSLGVIPAGTAVLYEVYLSSDATLNTGTDTLLYSNTYTGGLAGAASVAIPAFTVPVNASTVGGNYYLIFAANRDRNVAESDAVIATSARLVFLQKTNAPGLALDFNSFSFGGAAEWFSVTDSRASDNQAFQSPPLGIGQTATITLTVTGPTTIKAPWLIVGGATDTVAYTVDAGVPTTLTGFSPSYQAQNISVGAGNHTIVWTYTQNSASTGSYARVDLDLPSFVASGDGSWFGVADGTAPTGTATVASSPTLATGQQATLQVAVTGPAVASFWWRTASVASQDTLAFLIDGQTASLPTTTFFADPVPAVISGTTAWANVAFLVGPGTHTLSWVFSQNSVTTTSAGFVDGLQVLSPIPVANTLNRLTNPADHAAVPPANLDLAVTNVVAPTGTYLLDAASGAGRLPVTITVTDIGADFASTPSWNSTNLEIHLSTNRTFGDSDDINLGSFAHLDTQVFGEQAVFDGEINLPFDTPSGDYYLLIRYGGQTNATLAAQAEFTLANNTKVVGPGFLIQRAPNLVIDRSATLELLSPNYPYHPEDPVFIKYTIGNTGLGTVLPTQPFQVRVDLMSVTVGTTDLTTAALVKSFTPATYSLFLPEASGQYPNGGSATVTHFLDLPTRRDLLVALGQVPAGTPEDDRKVSATAPNLSGYRFFFRVTVDSGNAITESSETNTFDLIKKYSLVNNVLVPELFSITSTPLSLSAGEYFSQTIFSTLTNSVAQANPGIVLSGTTFAGTPAFASLIQDYALGKSLAGSPQTLFQPTTQNGYPSLIVPPNASDTYLSLTFDFNVRANDVEIDVQSATSILGPWSTLVTLQPPYFGTSGVSSLSGFGGLKDNPYVLAVDGNSTDVQQVYVARVTVRDSVPAATSGSRFMRLNVRPLAAAPSAPGSFTAAYVSSTSLVVLTWTGSLPNPGGAYVIERASTATPTAFTLVGSATGNSYSEAPASDTYIYRIRAVTTGGASTAVVSGSVTVP